MKLTVGSKNKLKIEAVHEAVALYPKLFTRPLVQGVAIDIELFGHPKSLTQTVQGAIMRAKKAFSDCDFSFGLESGLMEVPQSNSGFMETGVCALYNGQEIFLGISPAFEWPKQVLDLILANKADASLAFKKLGLTKKTKLGSVKGGIVGILTKKRMTREDSLRYAVIMALIQLENKVLYDKYS